MLIDLNKITTERSKISQKTINEYTLDFSSYEPFKEVITPEKIQYYIEKKRIGTYNIAKNYYITFRLRYLICLDGQLKPNIGRKRAAKKLGLTQRDGHFFHRYNSYGISNWIINKRKPEDVLVIVEYTFEEKKITFLAYPFSKLKAMLKEDINQWPNVENGKSDMQTHIQIDQFEQFAEFQPILELR